MIARHEDRRSLGTRLILAIAVESDPIQRASMCRDLAHWMQFHDDFDPYAESPEGASRFAEWRDRVQCEYDCGSD